MVIYANDALSPYVEVTLNILNREPPMPREESFHQNTSMHCRNWKLKHLLDILGSLCH